MSLVEIVACQRGCLQLLNGSAGFKFKKNTRCVRYDRRTLFSEVCRRSYNGCALGIATDLLLLARISTTPSRQRLGRNLGFQESIAIIPSSSFFLSFFYSFIWSNLFRMRVAYRDKMCTTHPLVFPAAWCAIPTVTF